MLKSKKFLTGVLASSIVILGVSVYSYSLFDSHAEPSVVETKSTPEKVEKKQVPAKSESKKQEKAVETKAKETEKAKETTAVVVDEFEGYIRVPHKIVAGENAWKIQSGLTPNLNIESMLQLVAKTNGKTQLHPIFAGETIYFLKEKDITVAQTTPSTQTTQPTKTETASKAKTETKVAVADKKAPTKNTGKTQPTQPSTNPTTVQPDVKIDNNTSTQDIIAMAKKSNNTSQNTVTIQYSPDVTVTLNNATKTGEVKRNYTYSQSQVQYSTAVDYDVVDTTVSGGKAIIHVVSPDAGSQAMYDISNELTTLIKEENSFSAIDVYFYDNQSAVNAGNFKWKFSDATPSKVMERETFTF
jgi:hypothetical protein